MLAFLQALLYNISMIKFESDMLILDSAHTKADAQAVNDFVENIKRKEREQVFNELKDLADQGSLTVAVFKLEKLLKL